MYMKSMCWVSIIALAPAVFLISSAEYKIALQFIVCCSAALIVYQAFRAYKYGWATAFLLLAMTFNPVIPTPASAGVFMWISAVSLGVFITSLFFVKTMPAVSVISIIGPPKHGEFGSSW